MNKIIIAVCILASAVAVEESVGGEDVGAFSYVRRVLDFPFYFINLDTHAPDVDGDRIPDGDQPAEIGGGIFSFLERLLLFPVYMTQEYGCSKRPKENDEDSWEILQMCKDSYLLEYVFEKGQRALSDLKSSVSDNPSLYDWKHLLVPFHYLQTRILHQNPAVTGWLWFESPACNEGTLGIPAQDTTGSMTHVNRCNAIAQVDGSGGIWSKMRLVLSWASLRYLVAGALVLSLLRPFFNIGGTKIVSMTKQLCSFQLHTFTTYSISRPILIQASEHLKQVPLLSFIARLFSNNLLTTSKQPALEPAGHYQMCEYFDTRLCNCGGKHTCRQLSPKLGHYKMCEFFDSLPCNCGGTSERSSRDAEPIGDGSRESAVRSENHSCNCMKRPVFEDNPISREQRFQAFSDARPREGSPEWKFEIAGFDIGITEDEKLLQLIHEAVDRYLMRLYPSLKCLKNGTEVIEGNGKDKENEIVTLNEQIVQPYSIIKNDNGSENTVTEYRSLQNHTGNASDHFTENVSLSAKQRQGSEDSHLTSDTPVTSATKSEETRHCISLDENLGEHRATSEDSSNRLLHLAPQHGDVEPVSGCSENIRDLIQSYAAKLKSDQQRAWNESVRPLKLDEEFKSRLNTLLSAGYKMRYYYANSMMGNPVPLSSARYRHAGELQKGEIDEVKEIAGSEESEQNIIDLTTCKNEIQKKTVHFKENVEEEMECRPTYENEDMEFNDLLDSTSENKAYKNDSRNLRNVFIDTNTHLNEQSGTNFDVSLDIEDEDQVFALDSGPQYLEDSPDENSLNITYSSDIGSPRHNSSFKDDSPYVTNDLVSKADLRAGGDGSVYSTITRRSPFTEVGLGDLIIDSSIKESERSILDMSDINSSMSFNRDSGILEVAMVFAMRTMWRLGKRLWQMSEKSPNSLVVEEKESGLFVIRQMSKDSSFYSVGSSKNNSASYVERNVAGQSEKESSSKCEEYDIPEVVQRPYLDSPSQKGNWSFGSFSSEDLTQAIDDNSNNNARFHRRKREALRENDSSENSSEQGQLENCDRITKHRSRKIYKRRRTSYSTSSSIYRRCGNKTNKTNRDKDMPSFPADNKSKRGIKRPYTSGLPVERKTHSTRNRHLASINISNSRDSDETCSERSGNVADESSDSSTEDSDIKTTVSKVGMNAFRRDSNCGLNGIDKRDCLKDSEALLQTNVHECIDDQVTNHERELEDILDQLQSLCCNAWELRDFRHLDINDNKSKCLAWAWECAESSN